MGSYFVEVDVTSDSQTLADDAVGRLQEQWVGWEPNDADLEVIQIEALAPMAQNAAETAARVPPAVFRSYGTKLIGLPYSDGIAASTTVTISMVDATGYTLPGGSEFDIDGYAFTIESDIDVPAGSVVVNAVPVVATEIGEDKNGLVGDVVTPISALAFVASVTVDAPTTGGTDQQDDDDYQSALSLQLLLQAKTLVTTRDFELWALSYPNIGRAVAEHTDDRHVTVTITTADGVIVPGATKDQLVADFDQYRLVNTVVTVADPDYTTIDVAYTVKALQGYDFADLIDRVNAVLMDVLAPGMWGTPKTSDPGATSQWVNDPIVRDNLLIDRMGDVEGVAYVDTIEVTGDTGASDTAGWVMAGDHPLPRPGVMTGAAE